MEAEEAALASELLDVAAGFGAEFLDGLALVADEDGFLAVALDEDEARDVVDAFLLLVALDSHLAAVGDFLLVVEEYLLAHDLADEEAHGAVGEFVLGEVGGMFGEEREDSVEDFADVEALGGGAGDDDGARYLYLPVGDALLDGGLVGEVYLVDDEDDGDVAVDDALQHVAVLEAFAHLGDEEEEVGVLQGGADEAHHLLVEFVGGVDDAGGVSVDNLEIISIYYAHDAFAGGLGLGGDDAEAFADEGVHQRGFAHVGVADDIYETAFHILNQD